MTGKHEPDESVRRRCTGHRTDGQPCGGMALRGANTCRIHTPNPRARANAAVRAEVARWLPGQEVVDPGEVLLRLVSQSAARAERYALLLGEAYEAAERLRVAHEAERLVEVEEGARARVDGQEPAGVQAAREDLRRVFNTGGVAALVGNTYAATKDGDVYATGEAIRGLARLEAEERDRCANFAAKAVAAGLEERRVRLAERYGEQIVAVLRAVRDAAELGLSGAQLAVFDRVAAASLRQVGAIEGGAR